MKRIFYRIDYRLHRAFSRIGFAMNGHRGCLRNGCEKYCGYNLLEWTVFLDKKDSPFYADYYQQERAKRGIE